MFLFYFSITIAIVSTALYHVVQKLTPVNANPPLTLFITYITSAALCLGLLPLYPLKDGLPAALKQLNWTTFGLAFALVGLEVGFLLAYRAGWNIGLAALIANIVSALVLVGVGLAFFKEQLTPVNVLGFVLCLVGLALLNHKS